MKWIPLIDLRSLYGLRRSRILPVAQLIMELIMYWLPSLAVHLMITLRSEHRVQGLRFTLILDYLANLNQL